VGGGVSAPDEIKARVGHELLVLLDDEVLVLVHDVAGDVRHPPRVVLHREAVLGALGRHEAAVVSQARPQRVCKVLHHVFAWHPHSAKRSLWSVCSSVAVPQRF